jgi:putative acyl-CoA dehydrogenase
MRNVLADLALESQAATLLAMRLAEAFDARAEDDRQRAFARVATAISKFWLCKRVPVHVGEALECLGGNGYVEESLMPRLYREAPLYSIWEGSGNVICLDVLRALAKVPSAAEALIDEMRSASGTDKRLDSHIAKAEAVLSGTLKQNLNGAVDAESQARRLTESLALALQGTLIVQHGRPEEAEAFLSTRLAQDHGNTFGTLPAQIDAGALLGRVADGLHG